VTTGCRPCGAPTPFFQERKGAERVVQKPARKRSSRDAYIYFDNDAKVRAPGDALSLIARIQKLQPERSD
jgi:uncharacterized protein YecE (DUF72 family)